MAAIRAWHEWIDFAAVMNEQQQAADNANANASSNNINHNNNHNSSSSKSPLITVIYQSSPRSFTIRFATAMNGKKRISATLVVANNSVLNKSYLCPSHDADPNNHGTFYLVTTGRSEKNGSLTERANDPSEADNPYGKLRRFTLNPENPTGDMDFEYLMGGGPDTGVSFDNMTVDTQGNVIIQEDRTAFGRRRSADPRAVPRHCSKPICKRTMDPMLLPIQFSDATL